MDMRLPQFDEDFYFFEDEEEKQEPDADEYECRDCGEYWKFEEGVRICPDCKRKYQ